MKPIEFPVNFQSFVPIRVGQNHINGAQALFTVCGVAPLLVADGPVPRVWLSAPPVQAGSGGPTEYQSAVLSDFGVFRQLRQ